MLVALSLLRRAAVSMTRPILARLTPIEVMLSAGAWRGGGRRESDLVQFTLKCVARSRTAAPKIRVTIQLKVNGSLLGLPLYSRAAETAAALAEVSLGTDGFRTSTTPAVATVAVRLARRFAFW